MRCRAARAAGSGPGAAIVRGQLAHVGFDRAIAPVDLSLTGVVEFQILLEREEQFRPVVAGQRRRDLGGRRPTPAVAKPRPAASGRVPRRQWRG